MVLLSESLKSLSVSISKLKCDCLFSRSLAKAACTSLYTVSAKVSVVFLDVLHQVVLLLFRDSPSHSKLMSVSSDSLGLDVADESSERTADSPADCMMWGQCSPCLAEKHRLCVSRAQNLVVLNTTLDVPSP